MKHKYIQKQENNIKEEKKTIPDCQHEFDPNVPVTFFKFGRQGRCRKCGVKLMLTQQAATKVNKIHMSKKERRKERMEAKKILQGVEIKG